MVLSALPTGGAVLLAFYGAETGKFAPPSGVTSMTISRSFGTPTVFTPIYTGPPVPYWVDVGDGASTSSDVLSATTSYEWQAEDSTGTTQVGPVTPSSAILTVPDGLTQLLIRLLQAAVNNAPLPAGVVVAPAQVTTKMPSNGWQALPLIVVNLELFQQRDTAVGQDVIHPLPNNQWTLPGWVRRMWRISVLSQNADERDFYRDTLMIAFRALKGTLFSVIGQNIRHDFQANSGTTGDEWIGQGPTFYWADVMVTLEGVFDVTVLTGYGLIEQINTTPTYAPSTVSDLITVTITE